MEWIEEAPGIITVVTAEEIQRYGARNLRDVLDRQTHLQMVGSNLFPHGRISMRGSTFTHVDNTVLPLLNGRPIRDAGDTSNNNNLYASFPVEAIKKIEIIRGPGSVLYGTNAFAGVINIVTKEALKTPEANLALTYGSFDTKKGSLSGGGQWDDFEFFGTISAFDTDGDDFNNITDEFGTTDIYKTGSDAISTVFQARYRGLTINGLFTKLSEDHVRTLFVFPAVTLDTEKQFVDIGYTHDLTDDWDISANFSYHNHDVFILNDITPLITDERFQTYFAELTTRAKLNDKLYVLAGGSYNLFKNGIFAAETSTISAYTQIDYWLFDWLKFIGGIQYNKPEQLPGDFSPRIAAIANINDHWGIKFLYGEAYREASLIERLGNLPGILIGDPNLDPETIQTFDAQLFYNNDHSSFAITYFHSEQQLIDRVGISPQMIINSGEVEFDGLELEGKWNFGQGLSFLGNLSYQTNNKDDGTEDVTYAPDWMVKTGLSYESERGYTLSLFNSYFAASTLQNQDINPTVLNINPEPDGYNLLTANLNLNLGEFLNNNSWSRVKFSLYGDNLLDEDIYSPSISRVTINSIPHHYGRGAYATISIDF